MNLRDLSYLVALADHCHFGKAAEVCFVSQPALSMQIKKLETLLGVQLIERTNKQVFLTEIGTAITQQAREILHHVKAMQASAKLAQDPFSGELRLGLIPTLAPYLLPHIMPKLSDTFTKLSFYLIEEKTPDLISKLDQGKLDAALLALPLPEQDFATIPLFEEEFLLAAPKDSVFSKRKSVKAQDLAEKTLLLLEEGHCLRDQALMFCQHSQAAESKQFRATSLETLRYMISSKAGITLMPKLACRADDPIHYLAFNAPKPKRTIGLVFRNSSVKKNIFTQMAKHIKSSLTTLNSVKILGH